MLNECRGLLNHMEWADARAWTAVLSLPSLQGDPRTRELLHHYHSTQWAYLQVWRGEPIQVPELSSFADLRAIAGWACQGHRQLTAYIDTLNEAQLQRSVTFPWADRVAQAFGSAGPVTLGESLLQVVLHSAHHRGQVASRVRELGGEPTVTDFLAWVWMERPAPSWEGITTTT